MSEEEEDPRVIGVCDQGRPGPTVLVTGGIHGNEPAGVEAARTVVEELRRRGTPIAGRLVCIKGNMQALGEGQRFLARDLNRAWTLPHVRDLLRRSHRDDSPEDHEQREILGVLRRETGAARGPFVLVDLHSTSAGGAPFTAAGDTMRNRRLAFALPLPFILGLEEAIEGSLIEFVTELGHRALALEGGRHDDPATRELHVSALWLLLEKVGVLSARDVPDLDGHHRRVAEASRGVPRVTEILHREPVAPEDGFRMLDRFDNFTRVRKGEVLALRDSGPVPAPMSGLVLLPLKQDVGSDGFFIGRPVRPLRRALASLARMLRLNGVLPLLPGVHRVPETPDCISADPRIARFLVRPVFNMLGYRRYRVAGNHLIFTRHRPDRRERIPFPEGVPDAERARVPRLPSA